MMRVMICVLAFVALAACKQNNAVHDVATNAQDLHIEIGRYGAMLNETAHLTEGKTGTGLSDPADVKELARSLREAVWTYNVQRSELCQRNLYTEVSCGPALDPVWMTEPADTAPSLADIQQRSQDVGGEIQKFWGAICDDARRGVRDANERMAVCPME